MEKEEIDYDQDENFYFIAGYISNSIPYGITWEQAEEEGLIEPEQNN